MHSTSTLECLVIGLVYIMRLNCDQHRCKYFCYFLQVMRDAQVKALHDLVNRTGYESLKADQSLSCLRKSQPSPSSILCKCIYEESPQIQ